MVYIKFIILLLLSINTSILRSKNGVKYNNSLKLQLTNANKSTGYFSKYQQICYMLYNLEEDKLNKTKKDLKLKTFVKNMSIKPDVVDFLLFFDEFNNYKIAIENAKLLTVNGLIRKEINSKITIFENEIKKLMNQNYFYFLKLKSAKVNTTNLLETYKNVCTDNVALLAVKNKIRYYISMFNNIEKVYLNRENIPKA